MRRHRVDRSVRWRRVLCVVEVVPSRCPAALDPGRASSRRDVHCQRQSAAGGRQRRHGDRQGDRHTRLGIEECRSRHVPRKGTSARAAAGEDRAADPSVSPEQIRLNFQPVVRIAEEQIVGVEVLARYMHPELGMLDPSSFMPEGIELGLFDTFDLEILTRSMAQLSLWLTQGAIDERFTMSVNLSPDHVSDSDSTRKIFDIIRENRIPPGMLQIEVTEHKLHAHADDLISSLTRFGSGASKWRSTTSASRDRTSTAYCSFPATWSRSIGRSSPRSIRRPGGESSAGDPRDRGQRGTSTDRRRCRTRRPGPGTPEPRRRARSGISVARADHGDCAFPAARARIAVEPQETRGSRIAPPAGLEPAVDGIEARCLIHFGHGGSSTRLIRRGCGPTRHRPFGR